MIDQGVEKRMSALPENPQTDCPSDLVASSEQPVAAVAIALAQEPGSVYRYYAAAEGQTWFGSVPARTVEEAALDIVSDLRARYPELGRARFVPKLRRRSTLWRHCAELSSVIPDTIIARPDDEVETLMRVASTALGAPFDLSPTSPLVVDGPPISVATDGSVRGKFTGCGNTADAGFATRGNGLATASY